MRIRKVVKIALLSLLAVGLLAYMVYASLFLTQPDKEELCREVELIVAQGPQTKFFSEKEVETLLKDAHLYPQGMLMADVDTKRIEEVLRNNDFVSRVECYKSTNGKLCVEVGLRTPVMCVMPDGHEGYLVDAQGKIISDVGCATNLVVASGNIDQTFAATQLADFGQFLQTDPFWNNQIEQIYVRKEKKGYRVELVPRVGDHIVSLGTLDGYQRKLRKLKTFYEKGMGVVGWNKYSQINLEYDGQLICTKRPGRT